MARDGDGKIITIWANQLYFRLEATYLEAWALRLAVISMGCYWTLID